MKIHDIISEERRLLEAAYKELGNKVYRKARYGGETRVVDMPSGIIVECLDMLDRDRPGSYWIEVLENELRSRNV